MIATGLDVHKDTIFCGIHNGKKNLEVKEFSTLTHDIRNLGEYVRSLGGHTVAMESTGIYWIPIWNILDEMGFELILVNPYLIKQMPGRKSDVKDAQWIATLLQKGLLRASLVPDKKIQELRTITRKYMKLQQRGVTIEQSMERILEVCNIRITSLVSNISGKSIYRIIESIVNGVDDPEELEKLVHGRIKNKHKEKVRQSLEGYIPEHHRFALSLAFEEYNLNLSQINRCLEKMEELCNKEYSKELELLQTIPGVSLISAMILIAETGADMRAFENSGKFTGWIGLRPRNDESAGRYKSTATTKGNVYLRATLVQIAWAATKTKGSYFKEKFNRLAMRKAKKKALIAIARKIAVVIWNVLNDMKKYNPNLLPILDPQKLMASLNYHQKELERLNKLVER